MNKIIYDVGKVTKSPSTLRGHFAPAYLLGSNMLRAYLFFIYECSKESSSNLINLTLLRSSVDNRTYPRKIFIKIQYLNTGKFLSKINDLPLTKNPNSRTINHNYLAASFIQLVL